MDTTVETIQKLGQKKPMKAETADMFGAAAWQKQQSYEQFRRSFRTDVVPVDEQQALQPGRVAASNASLNGTGDCRCGGMEKDKAKKKQETSDWGKEKEKEKGEEKEEEEEEILLTTGTQSGMRYLASDSDAVQAPVLDNFVEDQGRVADDEQDGGSSDSDDEQCQVDKVSDLEGDKENEQDSAPIVFAQGDDALHPDAVVPFTADPTRKPIPLSHLTPRFTDEELAILRREKQLPSAGGDAA